MLQSVRSVIPMRTAKTGYLAVSALLAAAGIFLIVHPEISAAAIGSTSGILLILFGAFRLVGYFSRDLYRLAFQFDLTFGLMLITVGVLILTRPAQLLVFIGFHALYFAIAELIAKPGGAVTATILTPIIIIMVLVLCEALLQRLLDDKAIELSAYWLSAFADTASFSNPEKKELVTAGVGSVIYAAVFYLLGQLFARRREV